VIQLGARTSREDEGGKTIVGMSLIHKNRERRTLQFPQEGRHLLKRKGKREIKTGKKGREDQEEQRPEQSKELRSKLPQKRRSVGPSPTL